MPTNRPMPLVGDERLEPHPVLGQPVQNYPSRRLRVLGLGWSVLIAWSLLVYYGTWSIQAVWIGPVVITVIAVSSLVIGWWILHQWNREIILYERGFTYREGSVDVPFAYAEVRGVRVRAEQLAYFGGLLRRVVYQVDITALSGDYIRVDNAIYRRVEDFAERLLAQVNTELRPLVVNKVQRGEPVAFADDLYLTNAGLRVNAAALQDADEDALLPWDDFGGFKIAQRQLMLQTRNGQTWYALPLRDVDNLTLLLDLLRQQQAQTAIFPATS